MRVSVVRLDPDLPLPSVAHDGDAGLDLVAREDAELLSSGGRATVPTGIAVAIEPGHVGLVAPRSGLAADHGVTVLNAPGVIDSGYRGEVLVVMVNQDPSAAYRIRRGDRIAQLLVIPVHGVEVVEESRLPPSDRGASGFGKSGR